MSTVEVLTEVAEGVIVRSMLTLDGAIDFACSGLAAKTRADYIRLLHRFANDFPNHLDVAKITEDDIARYLASRRGLDPATLHWEYRVLHSTFKKLVKGRKIKVNPVEFVPEPRRPDPDSRDLVRVSGAEVRLMLAATETMTEHLCVAILAYLGPRRHALALLRVRDYDRERRMLRFHEKGGKTIWKPVPDELAVLLEARLSSVDVALTIEPAVPGRSSYPRVPDNQASSGGRERASIPPGGAPCCAPAPDDYLIPPEGPLTRLGDRDDRVIWRIVKRVADRAGVKAHTHALRAAFADFCLDSGMDGKALQLLMGHSSPMTTERYTQRYDKERRMESARSLSWSGNNTADRSSQIAAPWLKDSAGVGAGGFEPPKADSHGETLPDSLLEAIRSEIQQEMGRLH